MTYIVGLTGGIGCGKTAATNRFATHGIEVVDADVIAREVVKPSSAALTDIVCHFGDEVLKNNGELNRERLRNKVFNHATEKQWLEDLLHPLIRQKIKTRLQQAPPPYVILSAPLLLETDLYEIVDRVLIIDCDEVLQLSRAIQRDQSNETEIKKIIQQQLSREERLSKADDIISNNGSLADLQQAVDSYHHKLIELANDNKTRA